MLLHLIIRQTIGLGTMLMLLMYGTPAIAERVEEQVQLNGMTLLISREASLTNAQADKIMQWLDSLTASMLLIHGEPPHPQLRIELDTSAGGSRAVPFGQIIRRQTPGIRFYVNPDLPLTTFRNDWTAYHEVSHLFIPYPGQDDIWLSEGLASYYQNVLRYRAGILSESNAWQKLLSGFKRARDDSGHADLTLRELSAELRSRYAFMRVYWSGALYFLEADIQLRKQTANKQSLDTVLGQFSICCLKQRRRWSGQQLVRKFDELGDVNIFEPLYRKYAASRAIPDYESVLAAAGIRVVQDNIAGMDNPPAHDLAGLANPPRP